MADFGSRFTTGTKVFYSPDAGASLQVGAIERIANELDVKSKMTVKTSKGVYENVTVDQVAVYAEKGDELLYSNKQAGLVKITVVSVLKSIWPLSFFIKLEDGLEKDTEATRVFPLDYGAVAATRQARAKAEREGVFAAASSNADVSALQVHLRTHLRELLGPALYVAVATLVEADEDLNTAGALACIQYTLDNGACLDARKEEGGETALIIAAKAGLLDAVNAMLEHWSSVDTVDGGGRRSGGPDVINAVGGKARWTALIYAAVEGHDEIVSALVGATGKDGVAIDLNVADKDGQTALTLAAVEGHDDVVTALVGATGKDGVAVDLNVAEKDGKTALLLAAVEGHDDVVTVLVGATGKDGVAVDLNVADTDGNTALTLAADKGHAGIATVLVSATGKDGVAVDLNVAEKDGKTALLLAADKGHAGIVTALVGAAGKDGVAADLNVVENNFGQTALLLAADKGHVEIVNALIGAPGKDSVAVDLNIANRKKNTALILAAKKGHIEVVTALLDAKAQNACITTAVDVTTTNNKGHTAHHYASTMHPGKFAPEIIARMAVNSQEVPPAAAAAAAAAAAVEESPVKAKAKPVRKKRMKASAM